VYIGVCKSDDIDIRSSFRNIDLVFDLLCMRDGTLLGLNLLGAAFNIGREIALVHARHESGGVGEEVRHLLERAPGGLW
jgi:hypothetical protein